MSSRIHARVCVSAIEKDVTCPICLGVLVETHTTMECMHRFCAKCINKSLRTNNKECPTCRKPCRSRRNLRPDPAFDALVAELVPSIASFEAAQAAVATRIATEGLAGGWQDTIHSPTARSVAQQGQREARRRNRLQLRGLMSENDNSATDSESEPNDVFPSGGGCDTAFSVSTTTATSIPTDVTASNTLSEHVRRGEAVVDDSSTASLSSSGHNRQRSEDCMEENITTVTRQWGSSDERERETTVQPERAAHSQQPLRTKTHSPPSPTVSLGRTSTKVNSSGTSKITTTPATTSSPPASTTTTSPPSTKANSSTAVDGTSSVVSGVSGVAQKRTSQQRRRRAKEKKLTKHRQRHQKSSRAEVTVKLTRDPGEVRVGKLSRAYLTTAGNCTVGHLCVYLASKQEGTKAKRYSISAGPMASPLPRGATLDEVFAKYWKNRGVKAMELYYKLTS